MTVLTVTLPTASVAVIVRTCIPAVPVGRFEPEAVEPTQPPVVARPEPPASSAHENVSGTGWPCVYTAPSAMLVVIVGATVSSRNVFD